MKVIEHELTAPWEAGPAGADRGCQHEGCRAGGVERSGDRQRARLLAEQGFLALAIRWFGGLGQPKGICKVPLETFVAAVDLLRSRGAERVGLLGLSKGAEAALLTAVHEPRVDVVVDMAPTSLA